MLFSNNYMSIRFDKETTFGDLKAFNPCLTRFPNSGSTAVKFLTARSWMKSSVSLRWSTIFSTNRARSSDDSTCGQLEEVKQFTDIL